MHKNINYVLLETKHAMIPQNCIVENIGSIPIHNVEHVRRNF